MSVSMSQYNKMVKKRDRWLGKTALSNAENRYRRKENKRFKRERDKYKQDLKIAQKEIDALKAQQTALSARVIDDKTTGFYGTVALYRCPHQLSRDSPSFVCLIGLPWADNQDTLYTNGD